MLSSENSCCLGVLGAALASPPTPAEPAAVQLSKNQV